MMPASSFCCHHDVWLNSGILPIHIMIINKYHSPVAIIKNPCPLIILISGWNTVSMSVPFIVTNREQLLSSRLYIVII